MGSLPVRIPGGVRLAGVLERLHQRLAAALEQDLNLLLCCLQAGLTVPRERHTALEGAQRLIEWHVAALEPLHEAFEFRQGLLKINGFVVT